MSEPRKRLSLSNKEGVFENWVSEEDYNKIRIENEFLNNLLCEFVKNIPQDSPYKINTDKASRDFVDSLNKWSEEMRKSALE
jgi:hypothetical protein